MTTSVTVKGLREAAQNMMTIGSGEVRTKIARDALRASAWVVGNAVKAATYTTFRQVTGWIKGGIGVRVAIGVHGTVLNSVIAEVPQYGGALNPMATLFRKHHPGRAGKRARAPALASVAFWWRFLEFGTRTRHARRTPKFTYRASRTLTRRTTARRAKTLAAYFASPSRGGIAPRPWVRPSRQSSQTRAVEQYEATMRERTEIEVNNLPK